MPASGDIITGAGSNNNITEKIKEGKVGGLFNIKSAEKIHAVQQIAVEQSRLKIPLIFGMDVIHGYQTVFPIPLGMSCSWDMALIEKSARIAAQEASADGICWTFSPMVDISRDPRWGRVSEGSGEDPYLGSQIAKAMVKGYQGDDLSKNNTILACVKHFALYGAAEAGRDYNTTDMSRVRMYNEYLPPYKAALDAGAGSVMASFNEIDGIPATGNKWLLTDLLRNQWGFNGFVVTDYTGILEMIDHGMDNLKEVSALALKAGVDMDMVANGLLGTLKESLDEGKVTQQEIDQACRRILEAKYRLGLFEDPYRYCDVNRAKTEVFTPENRQAAREIASQTFVLLKNDNQTLPLQNKKTIALVGPLVDNRENMPGTWSVAGDFGKSVSLLDGLKNALGDEASILYAMGTNVVSDPKLDARISIFGKPTKWDNRSQKEMIAEAVADSNFVTDQKDEFIQHIITNGNNLLTIIGDIMDISKLESGELKIHKMQINAQKFVSKVKSQFAIQVESRKLRFSVLDDVIDSDIEFVADTDRLMQVFNNLISNSLKFTENGAIEIGYQLKGKMVEFYVKDTGIGIPPEYHDKIFDRFRQVEDADTRKYGGNGLGLAITKNLVELMDGKIWLESEVGKGSTFYFTLPLHIREF